MKKLSTSQTELLAGGFCNQLTYELLGICNPACIVAEAYNTVTDPLGLSPMYCLD
jgi:hypothetical protein